MDGWIQLHRKLLEWEWFTEPNTFRVFIYCMLKANHKTSKYRGTVVERGSLLTSYEKLSSEVGLSVQSVRTSLKNLESTNELTRQSTRHGTKLSICNYDTYQNRKEDTNTPINTPTNRSLTGSQQELNKDLTTNNKDNNINNEEKIYSFDNPSIDPTKTKKPEAGKRFEFHKIYSQVKPFNPNDAKFINAYFQAVEMADGEDVVNMSAELYVQYCKEIKMTQKFIPNAPNWLDGQKFKTDWKAEMMTELYEMADKGDKEAEVKFFELERAGRKKK